MRSHGTLVVGTALLITLSVPVIAGQFDHSSYDTVLRQYVDEEGLVDYTSIRLNSLTTLESYFERLAAAEPAHWPESERLAFWLNAYNAHVLFFVAQKPGMRKISEDSGLFNIPFQVAGQMLSLNDIEHRILRATINKENGKGPIPGLSFSKADPRIHFGLVCGAVSSPKLRPFAYTAENVNVSLQTNAASFANSYKYVGVVKGHLQVSSLFQWYADDFKVVGGVRAYLMSLLTPEEGGEAQAIREVLKTSFKKTSYVYDWTVNAQNPNTFKQPRRSPARDESIPDALLFNSPTTK